MKKQKEIYNVYVNIQNVLRNKHDIRVFVLPNIIPDGYRFETHYFRKDVGNLVKRITEDKVFETYEDALEAGIEEGLVVLQEMNNKNNKIK